MDNVYTVYNRTSGHCAYCGARITLKNMKIERIFCEEFDCIQSLAICSICYRLKRNMNLENWRKQYTYIQNAKFGYIRATDQQSKFYFER